MSAKRKNISTVKKGRGKVKKVEYDDEDISSEHESDVEDADADAGSNIDGDDAVEDADDLAAVATMPELPPPEVTTYLFE